MTSSPTGRKSRAIFVARAIPEEPTETTAAASRQDAVVSQFHSRDARSGKLTSYAALGGVQDVERFDQFLAQQRGQLSASELRAAAASSDQKLISIRQKTVRGMQLERGGEATEDLVNRNGREIEDGVQKRREEVVAHRKWLHSLPIHERVNQQRQKNALGKWRQINSEWESFKTRAARRLNKAPHELVMSRAAAYREQREMYDVLQKARPLRDKVGTDLWLASLRDEGTRFVPVGNILSGLYCPIRESSKLGPSVRRPLDYYDNNDNREHEAFRSLSKLEERSLNLLAKKKWRLRKQLEVLQPHEVQHSANSRLAVETTDLFAWASGFGADGDQDMSDQVCSVNEEQEAVRRRQLRPYTSASSSELKNEKESDSYEFIGPSLRIVLASDDGESLSENATRGDEKSSKARLPPLRLSFFTPTGEQDQRTLTIFNDGDTIVHYQWWRAPFEDGTDELRSHLRGQRTQREEQKLEQLTTISISERGGTLLPGDTQQFVFSFESSKAGMYLAKWFLDANPLPRLRFGPKSIASDADLSVEDVPVEVRLTCVAVDNFLARRRRTMQLTRIQQLGDQTIVAYLVDEIVASVRLPELMLYDEGMPLNDVNEFYEKNGSNEFCAVYFSPDLVRDCQALYKRAQLILSVLAPTIQAPVVDKDSTNQKDADEVENIKDFSFITSSKKNSIAESAVVDANLQGETSGNACSLEPQVQDWNWCLKSLYQLCVTADEAQHRYLSYLTQQLQKEIDDRDEEEDDEEDDEKVEVAAEGDDEAEDDEDEKPEDEKAEEKNNKKLEDEEVNENANDDTTAEKKKLHDAGRTKGLARSQALEDEISAYKPDLIKTFEMLRYSAHTAPYQYTRLHQRLNERVLNLCSELPVVCEIAEMMNPGDDSSAYAAKVGEVRKLLIRAVDEAIKDDLDHQVSLEVKRRRAQKMFLKDKVSYLSINLKKTALTVHSDAVVEAATSSEDPPQAQELTHEDHSGVILMQVDLNLASWFSLVKAEAIDAVVPADEAFKLTWRLSHDLIKHENIVPAKILEAADAVKKVLNAMSSSYPAVHTVVLVSELSCPPLTRHMCNLLRRAAQANVKELSKNIKPEANNTLPIIEEDEKATRAAMESILERLFMQLSFQDIALVLQRAIGQCVTFCASVSEMQSQCRNDVVESASKSLDEPQNLDGLKEAEIAQRAKVAPKILLLEHLEAAGLDFIMPTFRKQEIFVSKPATPSPAEVQKLVVDGRKRSVAVTPKGKVVAPTIPVSATPVLSPSLPIRDLSQFECIDKDVKERSIVALRNEFMRIASVCVMDCLPSQACESVFAFTPKPNDTQPPSRIFAGPTLCQELKKWYQTLQPVDPGIATNKQLCILTAVIGGKSLESKLRLIDGLLDCAQEIYFVGEVAMSLYRVLHTKQITTSTTRDNVGMKCDEEDANVIERTKINLLSEKFHEKESKKVSREIQKGRARSEGSWETLVLAVEKLQQKANRKCVRLLLPVDWVVGETTPEEQDKSHFVEDIDEDEEDEEGVGGGKWDDRRQRKTTQLKSARQNPVEEPYHIDVFKQKRQYAYEGERAHVFLDHASSRNVEASKTGWQTFQDVTTLSLANAKVVDGELSILDSRFSESEDDDVDSDCNPAALKKNCFTKFSYDWTFRALDVGPIAMQALAKVVKGDVNWIGQDQPSAVLKAIIVNGVCGAVEFREFCSATNQLLQILQDYSPQNVYIAGNETASWLRHLESKLFDCTSTDLNNSDVHIASDFYSAPVFTRKLMKDRVMRNARVLKRLIAVRPHPSLVNLASEEDM